MRILIIEDEARMRDLLRDGLREHDHTAITASDGADGLALASAHPFDIVLLDLMLPGMDGWQVIRHLRRNQCSASVLMLTACDAEPDVIRGLDAGADDYLTKPFAFRELLARVTSLGRARLAIPTETLVIDTLVLDRASRIVRRGHETLCLTRTEFALSWVSAAVQARCSLSTAVRCEINLGNRMRLCAAQLKTNSQSTFSSPRSFALLYHTWQRLDEAVEQTNAAFDVSGFFSQLNHGSHQSASGKPQTKRSITV